MNLAPDFVDGWRVIADELFPIVILLGCGEIDFEYVLPVDPGPEEAHAAHSEDEYFENSPREEGDF